MKKKQEKYEASLRKRGASGDNNRMLPKASKCLLSILVSIIFFVLIFTIEYNFYDKNILLRIVLFIILLIAQVKVNSIIKWSFIKRYGYKFSVGSFEGIGLVFWVLNFVMSIYFLV